MEKKEENERKKRSKGEREGGSHALIPRSWPDFYCWPAIPPGITQSQGSAMSLLIIQHADQYSSPSLINKASGVPLSKKSLTYIGASLRGTLDCSLYIWGNTADTLGTQGNCLLSESQKPSLGFIESHPWFVLCHFLMTTDVICDWISCICTWKTSPNPLNHHQTSSDAWSLSQR